MSGRATVAAIVAACALLSAAPAPARTGGGKLTISVLSSRADLVSGGDALVAIGGTRTLKNVTVKAGRRNVTKAFRVAAGGRIEGVVAGLRVGRTALTVTKGRRGALLTVTNHPIGGPLLAGPQPQPWKCQETARDAQCNQPPTIKFVYVSSDPSKSGFQPYDPKSPPSDVATTTTDKGSKVPFIVRIETGYMDRDQYQIGMLYQPGKRWTALNPQKQWNHKLLIFHGGSCAAQFKADIAPDVTGSATPTAGLGQYALGQGFMTMSTALDNTGHNCNLAIEAESLLMAKEHIAERYGRTRYTIGTGCSGGSLAAQWISNAYPGVYQGILLACSFPDAMTSATQVADYALLEHYLLSPTSWGPGVAWSPSQFGAVEGNALPVDAFVSVGCTDPNPPYSSSSCPTGYFTAAVPYFPCAGVTDEQRYDAAKNPGGTRCSIFDLNRNLLGLRAPAVWSAAEEAIGRGFAGLPLDNVGVQYGLQALQDGQITAAQFVDLNAKIGGADIDITPVPKRLEADKPALANAYRTGLINETNNLDRTAIIDCRGADPGAAHDSYRAFAVRARLDREHGTHANQVIWEGPVALYADAMCERNAFIAMDGWLSKVERDHGRRSLPRKIVANKPADLTDACWNGSGQLLTHDLCGDAVVPVYGTARMVAGDAISTDKNKCQLKPLDRASYTQKLAGVSVPVTFTDAEWAQLQQSFPTGVCDFTKPGVDQQDTIAWQTYQDPKGAVIYGGRPLGPAPRSHPFRAS